MQSVNVLCIKWGSKYGPEYVNKLRAMVARNLSRAHRFVCLTDDRRGIDPSIEVHDIPKVGIPDFDALRPWTLDHGWLKLTCLADPLYDLVGPTLFVDLDVVIVGSLDCFFDEPGEFIVIKEWDKRDETGNTSVFRYVVGAHADVLQPLRDDAQRAIRPVRNEQEYMTGFIARQGKLRYWPAAWCRSFKRHCVRGGIAGWFLPPRVPAGARIIAFHGKPNPPDAIAGRSGKWYRRVLPTQWVADNWR